MNDTPLKTVTESWCLAIANAYAIQRNLGHMRSTEHQRGRKVAPETEQAMRAHSKQMFQHQLTCGRYLADMLEPANAPTFAPPPLVLA